MGRAIKGMIGRGGLVVAIMIAVEILVNPKLATWHDWIIFAAALLPWLYWGAYCNEP